jgi:hypothetical protein
VVSEITKWGGICHLKQLSIIGTTTSDPLEESFNQVYYLATPKIFSKRSSQFNQAVLSNFEDIYVRGFQSICDFAIAHQRQISMFYPSTIAIDQPIAELKEYIEAKKAGEEFCERMNAKALKGFYILVSRLPRINTDQTNSIAKVDSEDVIDTMIPIVRKMRDMPT